MRHLSKDKTKTSLTATGMRHVSYGPVRNLLARAGFDGFMLGLLLMMLLAYIYPPFGTEQGPLPLEEITHYGVSLIFFFYGLRLSPGKLRAGLSNWRLHIVIHLTTFVLFPLLVLTAYRLFSNAENQLLWLGIFYVAILPSTVSSSVVMVSIAGGNIPAAIFNASISSLIGVFITPMWLSLFLTTGENGYNIWPVIGKLTVQVILPVVAGMLLHFRLGAFAETHRQKLKYFDQSVILLIVYTSFCESFARELFKGYSALDIVWLATAMIGLFLLIYGLVYLISQFLGFGRPDRITALFCGSKKSLVQGTVMSKVLFRDANTVGIILLPIMLYHALQLIAASIIAQAMARHPENSATQE
jgi:sodium/bile acid cotransporter 7